MEKTKEPYESPWLWMAAGLLIVVLVGAFDWVTGPEYSFTLVYLVPLFLVSGRANRVGGALVAGASAVAYYWGQTPGELPAPQILAHMWNTLSVLAIFLVVHELLFAYQQAKREQFEHDWIDPVTGTGNSKLMLAALSQEMSRAKRFGRPFTVAYLDVVHLREVNQKMGHAGGDTLLALVAKTITRSVRHADVVARMGGDEFAVLLPETSGENAHIVVERVTAKLRVIMEEDGWPASIAVGATTFDGMPESGDEAVRQAERAMYAAKAAGGGAIEYAVYAGQVVAS